MGVDTEVEKVKGNHVEYLNVYYRYGTDAYENVLVPFMNAEYMRQYQKENHERIKKPMRVVTRDNSDAKAFNLPKDYHIPNGTFIEREHCVEHYNLDNGELYYHIEDIRPYVANPNLRSAFTDAYYPADLFAKDPEECW